MLWKMRVELGPLGLFLLHRHLGLTGGVGSTGVGLFVVPVSVQGLAQSELKLDVVPRS